MYSHTLYSVGINFFIVDEFLKYFFQTTICEALSERMGWDFLVIDTATFLADGLTNVAARIRYVFDRLLFLRKCVILFDEIEEFW